MSRMQDGGILQKMDEDWKRFIKTQDEAKTSGVRALSPQDIIMASISLAIGGKDKRHAITPSIINEGIYLLY